jgi:uncharacterized flavoprotein (TIGR03862 family)
MQIAVIGGGPAGLRAAEVAAAAGAKVTVFDSKASVGRKFLVAGRGGLNLTHAEPRSVFASRYRGPQQSDGIWADLLADFDADATRDWAAGLGVETFAASTGRVYPREMKGAPLLRRWVRRLHEHGVRFAQHHRWTGLLNESPIQLRFEVADRQNTTSGRPVDITADAVVLALGGASWPETGSDGTWASLLSELGIAITPLAPSNCGWETNWPAAFLAEAEGKPIKNVVVRAGSEEAAGELLVTSYGLEGGAIYPLACALREMREPVITIDFKPSVTERELIERLGQPRLRLLIEAARKWRLSDTIAALLDSHPALECLTNAASLARMVKACPIQLRGPRPIAEAISSAGGIRWSELDDRLMLRHLPGVFAAGEMIDWEAPTGGYLLQGCLATGTRAGNSALRYAAASAPLVRR